MKYIAAYSLLVLGGNATPSQDDVKKVLKSVGIDAEQDKLDSLFTNLRGKQLHEVIKSGSTKLSTISVGGGAATAAAGPAAAAKVAEKEEEPQEEEADVNMGDIFGGGDDY